MFGMSGSLAWSEQPVSSVPTPSKMGQKLIPKDVDWKNPAYSTKFDDQRTLEDWKLEGGKQASIVQGKLVLESKPAPEGTDPRRNPNHLVFWLKKEMPADFLLEFTLKPQDRKFGLNIVFFNARGRGGQSIFDPSLQPRDGLFKQYYGGDLNNYHISYWAGYRGSSNIRKNLGFHLVGSGEDLIATGPADTFQTVRLYKQGGTIRLMVDDVIAASYDDDGKTFGPIHTHSGWIGLRQMGRTMRCEYDRLAVYPLLASGR